MSKSIQHLRADAAEWAQNDITPRDGELALMRTESGSYRIKIGNGETPFSGLDSVMGFVKHPDGETVTPTMGGDYRFGIMTALTINMPEKFDEDFYTMITFDSDESATVLTYPTGTVSFSGDSVEDGVFVPEAKMHYTVFIWYDGKMQCLVRGVGYE